MSNQTKYNTFRQTYPKFVYESYQYDVQSDGLHIVFTFRISDDIVFTPTAVIPSRPFLNFDQPHQTLDTLVFHIGMIELISYWKCLCPPLVEVRCGNLTPEQIQFWKKLYFNGLGEFFYINGISANPDDFLTLTSPTSENAPAHRPNGNSCLAQADRPLSHTTGKHDADSHSQSPIHNTDRSLVPIGGGKDSVVTLELLQQSNARPIPLIMNPRGATVSCIQAAGYTIDDALVIRRTIHPRLLELNAQGCLNGHTPFSAMLAFYTLLAAQLSGVPNIALSNESSANESTVVGTNVNHQYSKSLEFENDFRHYVAQHISPIFNYYSFLRPLSELQIAMLFSRHEKYFDVFRSCNVGSKEDIWCGHCPKCLFAYIILSPFIPPQRLNGIFGKCMLDDPEMQLYFDQLTGCAETKPFECVGTISEVHSALSMTLSRWYRTQRPCLLQNYIPVPPSTSLTTLFPDHNLNTALLDILSQAVAQTAAAQQIEK